MGKVGMARAGLDDKMNLILSVTRFWTLVSPKSGGDCRLWLGDTDRDGYGIFTMDDGRFPAHELALTFTTGEVRADHLDSCHSCDNPPCCNPDHLRFDTRKSNVQEMVSRGRHGTGPKLMTDQQVQEMRIDRQNGAPIKVLAARYGVSESGASMICSGKKRQGAPGPITRKN